ncbi:family 16 glycoside hydrolase [Candidatus Latescibacterota bacterium]
MKKTGLLIAVITSMLSVSSTVLAQDYTDVRIKKIPVQIQCWTYRNFTFFETLEKVEALGVNYVQAYGGQVLSKDMPGLTFGPELSDEQLKMVRSKLLEHNIRINAYGVVGFENNEQSMREVFDFAQKMGIRTIVTEPAYDDYSLIEKMVREYNIKIAIHNHPIPNKYARPETVLSHVKGLDSRIGVCADTGHWMRSGINPLEAIRSMEGRIIDVHLKDLRDFGTTETYDVPFGEGVGQIHDILAELTIQGYQGMITVEHEKPEDADNPSPPVKKGIDYIKSITYFEDYEEILSARDGRYSKEGWNHFGPGYFELDSSSGILTSFGGMGLFWYTAKIYNDFILELDYKCLDERTNSGVFLRIPDVPSSSSYIYHSFEIQIDDFSEGIHHSGAVYDAEAPRSNAEKATGEWNHMKITCRGDNVKVELNGIEVTDWDMMPKGKIRDFARVGYIGLQNHDSNAKVSFKNVFIKELE